MFHSEPPVTSVNAVVKPKHNTTPCDGSDFKSSTHVVLQCGLLDSTTADKETHGNKGPIREKNTSKRFTLTFDLF